MADWGGKTLIAHIASSLQEVFPRVTVVSKSVRTYAFLEPLGVQNISDLNPLGHPLNGIQTGLSLSDSKDNFFTTCDMPFVKSGLIALLWDIYTREDARAAVCRWRGRAEPLFGFYSKSCAGAAARAIETGKSAGDFLNALAPAVLEAEKVSAIDPLGLSFLDLDTRAEYEEVYNIGQALSR